MTWEIELERIAEMSEMAEESALVELEVYGCIASDFERRMSQFDPEEIVCLYEYGVEWDEWGFPEGEGMGFEGFVPYSLMV